MWVTFLECENLRLELKIRISMFHTSHFEKMSVHTLRKLLHSTKLTNNVAPLAE